MSGKTEKLNSFSYEIKESPKEKHKKTKITKSIQKDKNNKYHTQI